MIFLSQLHPHHNLEHCQCPQLWMPDAVPCLLQWNHLSGCQTEKIKKEEFSCDGLVKMENKRTTENLFTLKLTKLALILLPLKQQIWTGWRLATLTEEVTLVPFENSTDQKELDWDLSHQGREKCVRLTLEKLWSFAVAYRDSCFNITILSYGLPLHEKRMLDTGLLTWSN